MSRTKFTEAPPECQLHHLCKSYCETAREVKESLCSGCLEVRDIRFSGARGTPWSFGYTNYKGEFSQRRATPIRFEFESTEHHPEKQWIMHAIDHAKGFRAFALKDMVLGANNDEILRLRAACAKEFESVQMLDNEVQKLRSQLAEIEGRNNTI